MDKNKSTQKNNAVMNYVYAVLIGLMVVACAVTIALVSTNIKPDSNIGGGDLPVSANTYVLPMKDATVLKDYSAKEYQYNDTLKQWEIHKAIDFKAGENLDVMAVCNGTISKVDSNYLEGTIVEISHNNGIISVYKSLAEDSVTLKVGDKVSAGQVIGKASDSMSKELNSGAHLHFEMTANGVKVDPNDYLSLGDK